VQTGDIFKINVYAVAKTPVNAVTLRINVPSGTVEVLGVDKGESVITLWTADPKVEGDTVILEGGTYRKGFVGKHLIATINVRAKQTGKATFITANANLLAGDGKGTVVRTDVASQGTKNLVITDKNKEIAEGVAAEVSFVIVTDINGDGEVSFADITSFMSAWTKKSVTYDFNQDGTMSFRDFSILLSDYFTGQ
jgi:glycine/D-amino acid oxidase-like deaminating enzyme